MEPMLSVIVTAYNRKEFLLEGLQSVINQTLERDKYEVICIKNFRDTKIDRYIKYNGIRSILKNKKNIGEYLLISAKIAKGKILVFLDDDDLFSKYKLERITSVFSKDEVGFYHNLQLKGKEFGVKFPCLKEDDFKIIKYPYKHSIKCAIQGSANMSSIAIKRNILISYSNELKKVIAYPDSFTLIISLISKTDVFIDNNKLTFYRLHNKNISIPRSLKKYLKFYKEIVIPAYLYQLKLADKSNVKLAKLILWRLLFEVLSDLAIKSNNRKDLIKAFKYLSLNSIDKRIIKRIGLSIFFLLGSNSPHKRLTRNFNNNNSKFK